MKPDIKRSGRKIVSKTEQINNLIQCIIKLNEQLCTNTKRIASLETKMEAIDTYLIHKAMK